MNTVPMLPALQKPEITAAGYYEISPEQVHGFRFMAALGLPFTLLLLLTMIGGGMSGMVLLLLVALSARAVQQCELGVLRRGSAVPMRKA